jgi:hypothetical protein
MPLLAEISSGMPSAIDAIQYPPKERRQFIERTEATASSTTTCFSDVQ